jgi:hypothetical protein
MKYVKLFEDFNKDLELNEGMDAKLAKVILDYLASKGERFSEQTYLSNFDRDAIKAEYGGRLDNSVAGPTKAMFPSAILNVLTGGDFYMDGTDLVDGDKTAMSIKPGKTLWSDVKQKLKL